MKIEKNEFGYSILYEVDDLEDFGEDVKIEDLTEIKLRYLCFVDDMFNFLVVKLNKKDKLYTYEHNKTYLLLDSKEKKYLMPWDGEFEDVFDLKGEDYEMEMLNKLRDNNIRYFTTLF